jgi:hypothetical protein
MAEKAGGLFMRFRDALKKGNAILVIYGIMN